MFILKYDAPSVWVCQQFVARTKGAQEGGRQGVHLLFVKATEHNSVPFIPPSIVAGCGAVTVEALGELRRLR